eukprot:TRINITY_DN20350_c0_g1_i1.p1 TRINITY_DN20350_c0_g1~~TRINITY_DN20350_c0_g1_i1.p1  ORF type:complete len:145 (+),score=11.87 TRINITY_DN20350_c0_g1_i1:194-628(+)
MTSTENSPNTALAIDELPFGGVLGIASGNVPCYSSDYDNNPAHMAKADFRSVSDDGVFFGYKWQCVELARRWLVTNHGCTFGDVRMAYNIFELSNVTKLKDGAELPMTAHVNGSDTKPRPGNLLIWDRSYDNTGHVRCGVRCES